jgi:excisionase family DNA binding protein
MMKVESDRPLRSVEETGEVLGVSVRTVNRILHRGEMPYYRVGKRSKVHVADLAAYLRAQRVGGAR